MHKEKGFNLNDYKTPLYICEVHTFSKKKFYYKQEYLLAIWKYGTKRPITEQTFEKRKKEGHKTKTVYIENLPAEYELQLNWINEKIDKALDVGDQEWFYELCRERDRLVRN